MKDKKVFDCIAFKYAVQTEIYEDIKDMTIEEEVRYFNNKLRARDLARWWDKIKNKTAHLP